MKYLILLSLIILTSCAPKFKVGDCIRPLDQEFIEASQLKVLKVGKSSYFVKGFLVVFDELIPVNGSISFRMVEEAEYTKIVCSLKFKE